MWFSRHVYDRAMLLRWQDRCENFSMPPNAVAYEENPTAAAALWQAQSASGNYGAVMKQGGGIAFVLMRPKAQWEVSVHQGANLYQLGSVFLHARRAKNGPQRLVCVYPNDFISYRVNAAATPGMYTASSPDFSVQVHDPSTYFHTGQRLTQKDYNVAGLLGYPFGSVRIFAGQADPNDESHFTIDIQTPAGTGTIDGYLRADDSVTLTLRSAATTTPAPR